MSNDAARSPQDKNQIGVTPSGRETLDKLRGEYFASEKAAFQAAIALALELKLELSPEVGFETKWGLGTMSEIVEFLSWYVPTDTPARHAERLGDAGLSYIDSKIETGRTISEIFSTTPRVSLDG
jgi:hypothetical protein